MMNDSLQYSALARLLAINNQVHDLENQLRRESLPTTALLNQSSIESAPLNRIAETLSREGGDLDGALVFAKLNVELHPKAAYSQMILGGILLEKGDRAEAIAALERAVELEPENPWAQRQLEATRRQDDSPD